MHIRKVTVKTDKKCQIKILDFINPLILFDIFKISHFWFTF